MKVRIGSLCATILCFSSSEKKESANFVIASQNPRHGRGARIKHFLSQVFYFLWTSNQKKEESYEEVFITSFHRAGKSLAPTLLVRLFMSILSLFFVAVTILLYRFVLFILFFESFVLPLPLSPRRFFVFSNKKKESLKKKLRIRFPVSLIFARFFWWWCPRRYCLS